MTTNNTDKELSQSLATTASLISQGAQDFDFLMGHWTIENRKMLKPLTGSDQWESFMATQHAQKLPAGIGNFDDFVPLVWRPGFIGMSLRIYNPETDMWSIYWLNNKNGGIDASTGMLTAPVVGRFENGVGSFLGADQFDGKAILVRYTWSDISPNSARWQQAFSSDEGLTWETNWIMQMSRVFQ
ncbi:hypothetical protein [Undibacterium sp. Ren11W]|uniref:hypothetical protein n=1 Tax=Undibacterium sp. Ren11W TaxID=3413045 RepID=UPI003BF16905